MTRTKVTAWQYCNRGNRQLLGWLSRLSGWNIPRKYHQTRKDQRSQGKGRLKRQDQKYEKT